MLGDKRPVREAARKVGSYYEFSTVGYTASEYCTPPRPRNRFKSGPSFVPIRVTQVNTPTSMADIIEKDNEGMHTKESGAGDPEHEHSKGKVGMEGAPDDRSRHSSGQSQGAGSQGAKGGCRGPPTGRGDLGRTVAATTTGKGAVTVPEEWDGKAKIALCGLRWFKLNVSKC